MIRRRISKSWREASHVDRVLIPSPAKRVVMRLPWVLTVIAVILFIGTQLMWSMVAFLVLVLLDCLTASDWIEAATKYVLKHDPMPKKED